MGGKGEAWERRIGGKRRGCELEKEKDREGRDWGK